MKIEILTRDGSPLGCSMKTMMGDDPEQIGVGGSETGLFTLCDAWQEAGHQVTLYNDPRPDWWSPFEQKPVKSFKPSDNRDVLIIFRTPNMIVDEAKGFKIWLSCDQYTSVPFQNFNQHVDKVVCISPFHIEYFKTTYQIHKAVWIDLPIRVKDFEPVVEKTHKSFISSSVPSRGLDHLFSMWPKIQKAIPDAKLSVTSDYRLWGVNIGRRDEQYVSKSLGYSDIKYTGALKRPKYIEKLMKTEVCIYPCIYEELQCLAIAEAQVAGVYTVTSDYGALRTTNMVKLIEGAPGVNLVKDKYIEEARKFLMLPNDERKMIASVIRKRAIERFSPDNVLKQWDEKVFK